MEHLGSHLTDFHEILRLRLFWKYLDKIQFSLKYKDNGTLREDQLQTTSLSAILRMRHVSDKFSREIQNTY